MDWSSNNTLFWELNLNGSSKYIFEETVLSWGNKMCLMYYKTVKLYYTVNINLTKPKNKAEAVVDKLEYTMNQ